MSQKLSKNCTFCKTEQPLDNFHMYKSGPRKGKIWSQCKDCRKAQLYEWRLTEPEKYKLHYRKARYKGKYGLSLEELKEFGECPLCLREKKLVVDHSHQTGKVRDFICYNCNTLLGHIENKEKMDRIWSYLELHEAESKG